ncbi:MAG: hypothetical protein IJP17_06420 [Clostridia bacterium]|nr:hypothetical protein [Clostridia bacterium]
MTIKLYDTDSHMRSFDATVLTCERDGERYAVILDRTAFFPEGGGQLADTGELGGAKVLDVQLRGESIVHYTDAPLEEGSAVCGCIDWAQRHRRMQNHSGEHIISGTINKLFGFNNVGFHMGTDDVTIDIDGELTREDLLRVEDIANRAIAENVPVTAVYPEADELAEIDYRCKFELTGDIRIVTIEGYDCCACCAPHVSRTGEIGMIKILDFMRYKGGVRIHILCGMDALDDYRRRYEHTAAISARLSAKQGEIVEAVARLENELSEQKQQINVLRSVIAGMMAQSLHETQGNMCAFGQMLDMDALRSVVNDALPRCGGVCAAFCGSDEEGYMYVIGSRNVALRAAAKEINATLRGKGGGRDEMIQGSVTASRREIEEYFASRDF